MAGWAVGEKKGNVEQEFAQNRAAASVPLPQLQAIRLVCHRAKIKATQRMCGGKATRRNVRVGKAPRGQ